MTEGEAGRTELPRLGSVVGHYRLDALLGRGGMGVVFRATDMKLDRAVAIKFLSPELGEDASFRERFVRESRLAAAIEHPAIVPIYEAGTLGPSLFIAMRYIRGRDLGRLLRSEAPLAIDRTVALLRPIAEALDAAHRQGLVHRDVKPANVLVERDGDERALLTDFGLSRRVSEPSLATSRAVLGTIDYAAPEQVRGEEVDGRADQYALACLAMHCISGSPPFEGDTDAAIVYAQVHEAPPRPSERLAGLPASLDGPMARGLAKLPGERYSDCVSFIAALEGAARERSTPRTPGPAPGHAPTPALPPSAPDPTLPPTPGVAAGTGRGRRPGRSRRSITALLVSITLIAVVAMMGLSITPGLLPTDAGPAASTAAEPSSLEPVDRSSDLRPGETIVFASDRDGDYDLYALRAGAEEPVKIRDTSADERSPAISPDGTTIAYVVGVEPRRDIWLMDIGGSRPRRLTKHPADDTDPAWSPDGKHLAFASRRSDPTFDIWEIRDSGAGFDEARARQVTDRSAVEHGPAWLPDARGLAIASNHFGGNRDIFRIDAGDSASLTQLTAGPAFDLSPAVAPDGKTIAFYRREYCATCPGERDQADILLMDADGRNERRYTRTARRDEIDPDWAPDGRALVFAAGALGSHDLYVRGADGKAAQRLTRGWGDAVEPTWGRAAQQAAETPAG